MIADNYREVLARIERTARSVGRDPGEIRLVVVTKGHGFDKVIKVVEAGARVLGENYIEEALPKKDVLRGRFEVEWHMIGHVQSRKARSVCQHFSYVHSLDSVKLARRYDRFSYELGRRLPVLLECNVSNEETKFGWSAWDKQEWANLIPEIGQIVELPNLEVQGLMTIPPLVSDPEDARTYFVRLRRLREFLRRKYPHLEWAELSMGMSADFEVAIQEGATIVRVGTAIMGERPT